MYNEKEPHEWIVLMKKPDSSFGDVQCLPEKKLTVNILKLNNNGSYNLDE